MFGHWARAKAARRLALPVGFRPVLKISIDLLDVVGNVIRLNFNPLVQAYRPFPGELGCMRPHGIRNEAKQLVSHLSKPRNETQGLSGALMEVSQCRSPCRGIIFRDA